MNRISDKDILIKLARELTDKFLNHKEYKLRKEHFIMFSISKFILLKEMLVKKDTRTNTLYFDDIKNERYIEMIMLLAKEIKKDGVVSYDRDVTQLESQSLDNKLKEAIWIFNKVRDSLAHGRYEIDLDNDAINIDNDFSSDLSNPFKLVCTIPVSLLNSISYYVEYGNTSLEKYKDVKLKYLNIFEIDKDLFYKNNDYLKKILYNNKEEIDYKSSSYINKTVTDGLILSKEDEIKEIISLLYKKREKETSKKTIQIIREMSDILGLGNEEAYGIVALYNYMSIVLLNKQSEDYVYFPLDGIEWMFTKSNGFEENTKEKIKDTCEKFLEKGVLAIKVYYEHPSEKFRESIMYMFAKFYTDILDKLSIINKLVLSNIRNGVAHGNFNCINNEIVLFNQENHLDSKDIKFGCKARSEDLFELTKRIDLKDSTFKVKDFYNTLSCYIDNGLLSRIIY